MSFSFAMLYGKPLKAEINYYELNLELLRTVIWLFMMFYIAHIRRCTEESPDDLQINHQIRVEAHLVA
ncbi:hypothetical protein AEA42_00040 [Shewanella sp. Sh95]|nr:hypothetical protein AEA42_00040 [Shewanella sp. Sh95]